MDKVDWEPFGDRAVVARACGNSANLAQSIEALAIPGIKDVVPAFNEVAVFFEPTIFDLDDFLSQTFESVPLLENSKPAHEIPVCYERGADLAEFSLNAGLSKDDVIKVHLKTVLECHAIGFCPGFPYLGWNHAALSESSRKSTPALRVAPGTVALMGRQCGIYPIERPGGWWQIGQTPLTLVDVEDRFFPIAVGDKVQFQRIDELEFMRLKGLRL